MVLDKGAIDKLVLQIEEECIAKDLEGIFISITPKDGRENKLFGKFFFFSTVKTPADLKGVYIGECESSDLEGHTPRVVVYEKPDVDNIMFDEFPGNYLDTDDMYNLLSTLSAYLNQMLPDSKVIIRNKKEFQSFLMPESKTLH